MNLSRLFFDKIYKGETNKTNKMKQNESFALNTKKKLVEEELKFKFYL